MMTIQLSENSSQESYLVSYLLTYLVSQTKCGKSAFVQMCITFVQSALHTSKYIYKETKDGGIQPCYQFLALLLHC